MFNEQPHLGIMFHILFGDTEKKMKMTRTHLWEKQDVAVEFSAPRTAAVYPTALRSHRSDVSRPIPSAVPNPL